MKFFKHVLMEAAGGGTASGGAGASAGASSGGASSGGNPSAGAGAPPAGASGGTSQPGGSSGNTPASSPAAGAGSGAPTDWTSTLNDDFKGFVGNKGWKDPSQVVDSYRNLEKLLGAPQNEVIRLPKDDDTAGWESVHSRLGRPATPEGYKLEVPKEGGSPEFAKWASEVFHKNGLSEKQGKGVVELWNKYAAESGAAQKQALTDKITAETTAIKKEWGAAYDQNRAVAQRAAREFGLPNNVMDAIESAAGTNATLKFLHAVGSKLGDAAWVGGNGGSNGSANGPMTPAQAKERIAANRANPDFVKRYTQGGTGSKEYMEMAQLHQYANPEQS